MNSYIFTDSGSTTQISIELSNPTKSKVNLEFDSSNITFETFFSYYIKNLNLNSKNYPAKELELQKECLKKSINEFIDKYKI